MLFSSKITLKSTPQRSAASPARNLQLGSRNASTTEANKKGKEGWTGVVKLPSSKALEQASNVPSAPQVLDVYVHIFHAGFEKGVVAGCMHAPPRY